MATMLGNWYARIKGGWKTVGAAGVGAFAAGLAAGADVEAGTGVRLRRLQFLSPILE